MTLWIDDEDERFALAVSHSGRLEIDGFRAERSPGAETPVAFEDVGRIFVNASPSLPLREANVKSVKASSSLRNGLFVVGVPFSLRVVAAGSGRSGLHRFPLQFGGRRSTGWIWLDGTEQRETTVGGFVPDKDGAQEIAAGGAETEIAVQPRPPAAQIVLQDLNVTPIPVKRLTVTASALNYGAKAGPASMRARWDGVEKTTSSDVAPGETKTIQLSLAVPGPGRHELHIEGFPPREIVVPGPVDAALRTAGAPDCCYQFPGEQRFYIRSPRKHYEIADEYQAVFRPDALRSHGTVTVKVDDPDGRGGWDSRSGIVVRDGIDAAFGPGYLVLAASGGNGWSMQWDADGDGILDQHTEFDGYTVWPHWLRLEREGDHFTGYYSKNGTDWLKVGGATVTSAKGPLDAGFFVMGATAAFEDFNLVQKE